VVLGVPFACPFERGFPFAFALGGLALGPPLALLEFGGAEVGGSGVRGGLGLL
jgi:hypothetical protein